MNRIFALFLCVAFFAVSAVSKSAAAELSVFAKKLLVLEPVSEELLRTKSDLLELDAVALPEGEALVTANDHFGWPIAVKAGDAMIVFFKRGVAHFGSTEKPDQYGGYVTVRSLDGGRTWPKPLFMKDFIKKRGKRCLAGMGAVGLDRDGAVVAVLGDGVFRSHDDGATWENLPGAFTEEQLKGPRILVGPRLIVHPKYGLVVAGHIGETKDSKRNPDRTPYIPPELWFRWSQDGGRTWSEAKQDLPAFATAIEPCMLMCGEAMLVVARCHGSDNVDPQTKTRRYVQLWSASGWLPFTPVLTTIRATDHYKRSHMSGPWTQDTVDISYNPISRRIECVATDRNGDAGTGNANTRDCQTLSLWSIDPADLRCGGAEWRFEARLLKRRGLMIERTIDGMHPGAAIVDEKAGVQHIFIYAGKPQGPSSIFRVTRTLDTEKLRCEIGCK